MIVENDHKPLESILKKSLVQSPPILQRLLFRLQKYCFEFKCTPGKDLIIADTLSRAHLPNMEKQKEEIDDEIKTYVNSVFIERIPIAKDIFKTSRKKLLMKLFSGK